MILSRKTAHDYTHDGMLVYRYVGPTMVQFEDGEVIGDERIEFYVSLFFMAIIGSGLINWKDYPWPLSLIVALRNKFAKWS